MLRSVFPTNILAIRHQLIIVSVQGNKKVQAAQLKLQDEVATKKIKIKGKPRAGGNK